MPLTFAHCDVTAYGNSSYHPQFPSWSFEALAHHNSFRDHTTNQVRKEGYLGDRKIKSYFARLLFRYLVSLLSWTVWPLRSPTTRAEGKLEAEEIF